jgi:hypothetical protein
LNRSTSLRLLSVLVLTVTALAAGASCEAPSVGDTCSQSCSSPSMCAQVCPCGNASCPTWECVVPDEAGAGDLMYLDGGLAGSCNMP